MRNLVKKMLFLMPIPLSMLAVSLAGDPAHLFSQGRYEKGIASILLQHKNAEGIANCDERLVQRYYAQGTACSSDVLVLGSSRSLLIGSRLFPGKTLYNGSVSGASLEDLLAVYQLHRSRGQVPSTVILNLDPWLLNRNNGQVRWKSLEPEYRALAGRLASGEQAAGDGWLPSGNWQRYLEALSPDYSRQSVKSLMGKGGKEVVATTRSEGDSDIKLWDGSLSYKRSYRARSRAVVESEALTYAAADPIYSLGGFAALDPTLVKVLESFVQLLQKDGAQVRFCLLPYHPQVYHRIVSSRKYRMLPAAEAYYRRLARAKGIAVSGSYDPGSLGLDGGDFHDGMHPTSEATAKILLRGAPLAER